MWWALQALPPSFASHTRQRVHALDQEENDDGHQDEVENGGEKRAVTDLHFPDLDSQIAQIRIGKQADQRGNDVVHQRIDDRLESRADDNADCQIHHVAAQRELLELIQQFFHVTFSFTPVLLFGRRLRAAFPLL